MRLEIKIEDTDMPIKRAVHWLDFTASYYLWFGGE